MSKPQTVQSQFIGAPIDGMNLVSPPPQLTDTEARMLKNYYIFDWGIRERGPIEEVTLPDAWTQINCMIACTGASKQSILISTGTTEHIYRYEENGTITSLSATANNYFFNAFIFNTLVFMMQPALAQIAVYSLVTETYGATSFTIPGGFVPNIGWVFKNRCYFVNDGSAAVNYGGVAATSGTITDTFDFAQIFQKGFKVTWGCSWSYNQGQVNDELFVVGNEQGEVLIYTGDYPAADNWALLSRLEIPPPLGSNAACRAASNTDSPTIIRLGQDILITTQRGVVSLAQIFAGRQDEESYYSVSRKIGPLFTDFTSKGNRGARSSSFPFAYFPGRYTEIDDSGDSSDGDGGWIYVLNWERGAWSVFKTTTPDLSTIKFIECSKGPVSGAALSSYVLIYAETSGSAQKLYRLDEDANGSDPNSQYEYDTKYFDFGRDTQKRSSMIRVLMRDIMEDQLNLSVAVSTEFDDSTIGAYDTKASAVVFGAYKIMEAAPPGVGKYLSYRFSKVGHDDRQNEIAGFTATFEDGGLY